MKAALRALVKLSPDDAQPELVQVLQHSDHKSMSHALTLIRNLPDDNRSKVYTEIMKIPFWKSASS